MSNFKIIFTGVFVVVAVVGFLVFAGVIKLGGGSKEVEVKGTVKMWGTLDDRAFAPFLDDFAGRNADIQIVYTDYPPEIFEGVLIEAIASGTPPDLILLPDELLGRFGDKITRIPFESISERTFIDTFVGGASIFKTTDGILAIPFAADPLVLYYNKSFTEASGMAEAPKTWQEFSDSIPRLTRKSADLTLSRSGAALGAFRNISYPKDILALLFMQAGSTFITTTGVGFGVATENAVREATVGAMEFYMAFSDPLKEVYSWNTALSRDRDAFIQSELVYYFGLASELPIIRERNPNLNFDITIPPQTSVTGIPLSVGHFYGLAIPKGAPDQLLSYTTATMLSNNQSQKALAEKTGPTLALMPVRRDVLADRPANDPYLSLLYSITLITRSWFDPNPTATDAIFDLLVRDINSGVLTAEAALSKAASQIQALGGQ